MPKPNPETLVRSISGTNHLKIACETATTTTNNDNDKDNDTDSSSKADTSFTSLPPTDCYPADSFCLSKEDELDWFDRNVFYERKESTKGNSNSNSNSTNPNSTSQRSSFSLKSKASIIGLPKPQKNNYADCKFRRNCNKPVKTQFFPKRSRWSGRNTLQLSEPTSPKVSCIGRVRSKKDRSRRNRRRRDGNGNDSKSEPEVRGGPVVRTGFWRKLKTALGLGRRKTRGVDRDPPTKVVEKNVAVKKGFGEATEAKIEPPGLGGLKRFVSGRRSESWGGGSDVLDFEVSESESDDQHHGDSVLGRRGVGPLGNVDCGREWELVGPATV